VLRLAPFCVNLNLMKLVMIGENLWIRILLLLGCSIGISLLLRFIVLRFIPGSPLHEMAKEGAYFLSMITTVLINHFWIEALSAEKAKAQMKDL